MFLIAFVREFIIYVGGGCDIEISNSLWDTYTYSIQKSFLAASESKFFTNWIWNRLYVYFYNTITKTFYYFDNN